MAEIRDDRLFTQPDGSYLGECPICCLPLSLDKFKSAMKICCGKLICRGCDYANFFREQEQGLEHRCLYCREPIPTTKEEGDQHYQKRIKANDPVALSQKGILRCNDEGDYEGAIKYWTKAAELSDMEAHYSLSCSYRDGQGVEKDEKKSIYHLEEASIGGHPLARYNLACIEHKAGRMDRAMKHFIIASKLGDDLALEAVKKCFLRGYVSKEDYEAALRGHQAAVDATKSSQREDAEKAGREGLGLIYTQLAV